MYYSGFFPISQPHSPVAFSQQLPKTWLTSWAKTRIIYTSFEHSGGGRRLRAMGSKLVGANLPVDNPVDNIWGRELASVRQLVKRCG